MDRDPDGEAATQWQTVKLAPGIEWSGRARYAAAMYFHARGDMDGQTLEVYRYLARLDDEDPEDVLRRYRIGADWLARLTGSRLD